MMKLGSHQHLIIRNQEILTDLLANGWTKLDVENPKYRTDTPGVLMGNFVHPLTAASADPDPETNWTASGPESAIHKRASEFLAEPEPWTRFQKKAQGRWLVFMREEPAPQRLPNSDWQSGSILPFLPKTKTDVAFEHENDVVLFQMLMS